MSPKNWHQNWTLEMCKCRLRSLSIWLGEVHLHIYKERTVSQSLWATALSTCLFSLYLGRNSSLSSVLTRSTLTSTNTHTYLIWDKCLLCENTEAFSAWRQSHRHGSLSRLLSCPHGHLPTNVLNEPALLCSKETGPDKPQRGRLSSCSRCRALETRSMRLPSPSFL